eukprot:2972877-Lingulodinium_polyedra.AAC.1
MALRMAMNSQAHLSSSTATGGRPFAKLAAGRPPREVRKPTLANRSWPWLVSQSWQRRGIQDCLQALRW